MRAWQRPDCRDERGGSRCFHLFLKVGANVPCGHEVKAKAAAPARGSQGTSEERLRATAAFRCTTQGAPLYGDAPCKSFGEGSDDYRSAMGPTVLPRGPTYSARGRMRRLPSHCSSRCAVQPVTRLIAKIGVYRSDSIPRRW